MKNILTFYILCFAIVLISGDQNSCAITICDTNYTLTLSSSNSYQGDSFKVNPDKRSRSKRVAAEESYGLSGIHKNINTLVIKHDRFQKRIIKEMKQLSRRVLRESRKMENVLGEYRTGSKKSYTRSRLRCPEGFVTVDAWPSCYMFSQFNTTWFEANDICNALDSDLVAMEEVNEHFVVTYLIRNNPTLSSVPGWWTSGSYISNSKQWVWKADSGVCPFSYIKWAPNEPNDEHDQSLLGMIMLKVDRLLWHDRIYTDKYNFVCEKVIEYT